jgi:hypothetical protein
LSSFSDNITVSIDAETLFHNVTGLANVTINSKLYGALSGRDAVYLVPCLLYGGVDGGLDVGPEVHIGGHRAVVTSYSESVIDVTVPSLLESSGCVDVSVNTTSFDAVVGKELLCLRDGGSLLSVSPTEGPLVGSNLVTLFGLDFNQLSGTVVVSLADVEATIQSIMPNELIVRASHGGTAHFGDVVVQSSGNGFLRLVDEYKYNPSGTIDFIYPTVGSHLGGDVVTIVGNHLGNVVDIHHVYLDTIPSSIHFQNDTHVIVSSGPSVFGSGVGDVEVQSTSHGSTIQSNAFTYTCDTGYYGLSCIACPGGGSTPCTLHGNCSDGVSGTGKCSCEVGYVGVGCQFLCPGGVSLICSLHGECHSDGNTKSVCDCLAGYYGMSCSEECPGGADDICNGHGKCFDGANGNGMCECADGYFGDDCSKYGAIPPAFSGGAGSAAVASSSAASASGGSGGGMIQVRPFPFNHSTMWNSILRQTIEENLLNSICVS